MALSILYVLLLEKSVNTSLVSLNYFDHTNKGLRDALNSSDCISLRDMRQTSPDSSQTKTGYCYQSSDMI